ncbi:Os04g0479600 [Oryza sativa Japonica Group]|jgi:hypothetical protein|uniref:Os04g0479600 protein n=1 Tax=Oryza sativa subsp. japonica TaxID=39947 RepID=A0A0N7KJ86_ORYSJ|nr:Os04g0479600 [Oryza sativa Japonica Group]
MLESARMWDLIVSHQDGVGADADAADEFEDEAAPAASWGRRRRIPGTGAAASSIFLWRQGAPASSWPLALCPHTSSTTSSVTPAFFARAHRSFPTAPQSFGLCFCASICVDEF